MTQTLPTPAISTLNVALLLRVADTIAKHPESFDMREWDCGTTACIAGWTLRLAGLQYSDVCTYITATHILGIDVSEAHRLFYLSRWPQPFTSEGQVVERIHHFIHTGL